MAHPQIAVFARLADGNAQTVRRIEGQKTLLARTQHSIFHDHIHDELVLPQPWAGAILTFRGDANGEVAPIRIIRGSKTGLALASTMAVDPVHNEYFVPVGQDRDVLHVFDRMAEGDVEPIRVLNGAGGGYPSVDYEHDLILTERDGEVLIFNRTEVLLGIRAECPSSVPSEGGSGYDEYRQPGRIRETRPTTSRPDTYFVTGSRISSTIAFTASGVAAVNRMTPTAAAILMIMPMKPMPSGEMPRNQWLASLRSGATNLN